MPTTTQRHRSRVYRLEFNPEAVKELTDQQLRNYIKQSLVTQGLNGFVVIKQPATKKRVTR